MENSVKVSIIIPVYNTEKYLKQSLDSVINQSLKDIEIICINDGSTDNSLQILEEYSRQDERIKIITQPNQGQASARNLGMSFATGEYIGFLDSDDWVENTAFEQLYYKSNNNDIIMAPAIVYNQTQNSYDYKDSYFSLDIIPEELFNREFSYNDCSDFIFRICVAPWNKLYKRQFLTDNNILFPQNLIFEDNLFTIKALLKSKSIKAIKTPLFYYRIDTENSTTHSSGKKDYKKLDIFKILKLEEDFLKEVNEYKNLETYFKFHRKSTLFYWQNKIKHPLVKLIYKILLWLNYPNFPLIIKLIKLEKFKKELNTKLKTQNTYIWIEENQAEYFRKIIKTAKLYNLRFITDNENFKTFENYAVENINNTNAKVIIGITSNYYKYSEYLKSRLKAARYNINVEEIIFPLI